MPCPTPYPDPDRLQDAARAQVCVPCHNCANSSARSECAACFGTGWLRPCGACLGRQRDPHHVCLICAGQLYTAGSPPGADEDERIRAYRTGNVRLDAHRSTVRFYA